MGTWVFIRRGILSELELTQIKTLEALCAEYRFIFYDPSPAQPVESIREVSCEVFAWE